MFSFREWRLRRIARRLTWLELHVPEPDETEFTAADLYEELFRKRPDSTFLDYYTRRGIEDALRQYGTWGRLEALGLEPHLTLERPDETRHLLRVSDGPGGPLIVELVARFAVLQARVPVGTVAPGDLFDLIAVEWLLLQNPRRRFLPDRPRLPGQKFPGLGLGREVQTLLDVMGERLQREGLIGFPEHYHNAIMYAEKYRYLSPASEGRLRALRRDLEGLTLAEASWAVDRELVTDASSGEPFRWIGEEMVRPLNARVTAYFAGDEYEAGAARSARELRFAVDREALRKVMAEMAAAP